MALKSIISIDVEDAAFNRYAANFQKYQALLAKTPDAWKKVTQGVDATRKSFDALVSAAAARQAYAKLTADAEKVAARSVESSARSWRDMARNAGTFATNITSATRQLLRWASLTGVISGVLGAGGLFGIDRLAISAAGQRRSSSGLGITAGENRAFSINYGRIVDTQGVLSGVNTALTDASQRGNLLRAGLTERDIAGKDAAQVSAALIDKLKALADKTPTQLLGNIVKAYGLESLGIDEQTLRRLQGRSAAEISSYHRDFDKDAKGLNLLPGQLSAWEQFKVQLDRAGAQIEQTFIKVLTPLTPKLTELSVAFSRLVQNILGGEAGKSLIDQIAAGLGKLAATIGSQEFQKSIETFAEDIGKIAKAIHWWFSDRPGRPDQPGDLGPGLGPGPGEPTPGEADRGARRFWDWFLNHMPSNGNPDGLANPTSYRPGNSLLVPAVFRPGGYTPSYAPTGGGGIAPAVYRPGGYAPGPGDGGSFSGLETANGLPRGLLSSVEWTESRNNPNAVSSAGAQGAFQFMPGTWKTWGGGGSPWNVQDASQAAARYLGSLLQRFHGDISKAVASYNWGEGNVEKDVARWGNDWQAHLPRETQGYLRRVLGGGGAASGQQVAINIWNHTGGSAVVTASQLPA